MSESVPFVIGAYAIALGALAAYVVSLRTRAAQERRERGR